MSASLAIVLAAAAPIGLVSAVAANHPHPYLPPSRGRGRFRRCERSTAVVGGGTSVSFFGKHALVDHARTAHRPLRFGRRLDRDYRYRRDRSAYGKERRRRDGDDGGTPSILPPPRSGGGVGGGRGEAPAPSIRVAREAAEPIGAIHRRLRLSARRSRDRGRRLPARGPASGGRPSHGLASRARGFRVVRFANEDEVLTDIDYVVAAIIAATVPAAAPPPTPPPLCGGGST